MFSDSFKKSGGSGLFMKMGPGDKEVGAFVGEPLEYMDNFKLKTEFPLGLDSYPEGTRPRFKINFVSKVDGKFIPRVFQGNKETSANVEAVVTKFGRGYLYEITCTDTGKKFNGHPVSKFSVLPERPLTEAEQADLAKTEMIELKLRSNEPDGDTE